MCGPQEYVIMSSSHLPHNYNQNFVLHNKQSRSGRQKNSTAAAVLVAARCRADDAAPR